jgi:hypothetical protein
MASSKPITPCRARWTRRHGSHRHLDIHKGSPQVQVCRPKVFTHPSMGP